MEANELKLYEELSPNRPDLQALREEHILLSKQLESLEKKYTIPLLKSRKFVKLKNKN